MLPQFEEGGIMRELDIAFDLLNTTREIIEKKPGLELLCYLVSMAIQEIEDRRKDINKSPLPP